MNPVVIACLFAPRTVVREFDYRAVVGSLCEAVPAGSPAIAHEVVWIQSAAFRLERHRIGVCPRRVGEACDHPRAVVYADLVLCLTAAQSARVVESSASGERLKAAVGWGR